jgi:hypothetical protein
MLFAKGSSAAADGPELTGYITWGIPHSMG